MKHSLRRLAVLVLACLLACALPCAAFAESGSMTLTVQVPERHTLTVQADQAEVLYNGTAATSFLLVRHSDATLLLRPATGRRISKVLYNGADVTAQLNGGYLTLPKVSADGTLQVSTTAAPQPPAGAAKRYTVTGTVTRDDKPLAGVTLELHSTPKTSVTDANGAFRFDDVETGWHTLMALENGVAIGYAEFELTAGTSTDFKQNTDGSFAVTVQADKAELQLQLALVDQKLVLQTATATSPSGSGDSGTATPTTPTAAPNADTTVGVVESPAAGVLAVPATGDDSALTEYLLLVFTSAFGLMCLSFLHQKRKH